MLEFYLISIVIYWIAFLEFRIRRAINKDKIIHEKTSISYLKILRLIIISLTPIFNLIV